MKQILFICLSLSVLTTSAQDIYWKKQLGSDSEETASAVAADPNGNVFTAIRFTGTTTIGDSTFISNGVGDIAIVKLDQDGEFISAFQLGGSYNELSQDIEVDAAGNVYWVGASAGLEFNGNTYNTQGGLDCIIAKWNNDLEPHWAKLGGSNQADRFYDCATDESGNVYFIGYMRQNAQFDGVSLTPLGDTDIVIGKIRADGTLAWLRNDGGSTWDAGFAIAMVDEEHFVAGGEFINSANISGIDLTSSSGGNDESWVAMYDTAGVGVWANKATNTGYNAVQALAVDGEGYVYVGGYFEGTTYFEGDTVLTSQGDRDMYLVKYSPTADFVWARAAGSTEFDQLRRVVANDVNDKIHLIGAFQETLTITPNDQIVSNGGYDIAVISVTSEGDLDWYAGIGGTENDQGYGLSNDGMGRVYAAGFFSGDIVIDGEILTPSGPNDGLLVKISPCVFPVMDLNPMVEQQLCQEEELGITLFNTEQGVLYTVYANGDQADSETQGLIELNLQVDGSYFDLGSNVITVSGYGEGCAEEVVLDTTYMVEIYENPTSDFTHQEIAGESVFTDQSTSANQIVAWEWDIEGTIENTQNVTVALSNGDYNVCLNVTSEFGCENLFCQTISVLTSIQEYGEDSLNLRYDILTNTIHWSYSENLSVEIYDLNGRLVLAENSNNQLNVSELPPQMYVFHILNDKQIITTGKLLR